MGEWRIATVRELVDEGVLERPMDGNHGEIHPKTSDFVTQGIPFIMASDLINGRVDTKNCSFISEAQARSLRKGFALPGDVLITHKATMGRTAIVDRLDVPFLMLTPQVTYYRVKDPSRLINRYLKVYFDGPEFQRLFETWGQKGSTRSYLGITAQLDLPIVLPLPEEQQAIASSIGALDDKIELNRRMNETLEVMARALFKDWFVDFGPTRAKQEGREPYLVPELWSLFPERLDAEGKPEGWEVEALSGFFSIVGGGTPKTSVDAYWGGGLPWFSVVDTPPTGSVFVVNTEKTITERGLKESSARLVPAGTTIITARGTVGKLAVVGRDMAFNQSCFALRALGPVGDFFVFLAAQHMVERLQAMAHGSVFSTISRKTFESLAMPKPSEAVLHGFESSIRPFFHRLKANVTENITLAQTRDLLLPKLMSGQIRVREAARTVEAAL